MQIGRELARYDLSPGNYVFIETTDALVERFSGDENVWWRLMEEGNVAMNRGMDAYPEVPLEILVCADKMPSVEETIVSVLHEVAHLRGITDEKEAEQWARRHV